MVCPWSFSRAAHDDTLSGVLDDHLDGEVGVGGGGLAVQVDRRHGRVARPIGTKKLTTWVTIMIKTLADIFIVIMIVMRLWCSS